MRFFILALSLLLVAPHAMAKVPSREQMKYSCEITKGTWQELPAWCDNMHPRTFRKLSEEHRLQCVQTFNEPCECGKGMRFSIIKVLGCVRSNFAIDQ